MDNYYKETEEVYLTESSEEGVDEMEQYLENHFVYNVCMFWDVLFR